jgi:hypothetical protein
MVVSAPPSARTRELLQGYRTGDEIGAAYLAFGRPGIAA